MKNFESPDLVDWLADRLTRPLPGWRAQGQFQPELSFGRHFAPPPPNARHAAVIAILYFDRGRWTIPLTLRPADLLDHAWQISLPGGVIEVGERSEDAARRELQEELGVLPVDLRMLGELSPLYLYNSNFYVTPWLAAARARPAWVPNLAEVAELIEAPIEELLLPSARATETRTLYGIRAQIPVLRYGSHRIWGGTCMILGELLALVEEFGRSDCAGACRR